MRERIRSWRLPQHAPLPLTDIARILNPILQGRWQYCGRGSCSRTLTNVSECGSGGSTSRSKGTGDGACGG
ncbi:group II intron maturase-specific domain-containing protein [Bradyrhizobium yuanmingense]